MFVRRAAFFGSVLATASQAEETCSASRNGRCAGEDSASLLQANRFVSQARLHVCNHSGVDFVCNDNHKCCGGICVPMNAKCCINDDGINFQCDEYSECCGNACAAHGSKCCATHEGYLYPVSKDTTCDDQQFQTCTNTYGVDFACGINSTCCGDVCVGDGGVCCYNEHATANSFACGAGSSCCGNSCAGEGGVCCEHNGEKYPVAAQTICPTTTSLNQEINKVVAKPEKNSDKKFESNSIVQDMVARNVLKTCSHNGWTTHCPVSMECCGHSCMPASSVCCTNDLDYKFQCGAASTCCGNACAAPGSKCCTNGNGYKYPVAEGTACASDMSITCNTGSHGQTFYCGVNSTCCGDICVGAGGNCCVNQYGHSFACGSGSGCCGNTCAGAGSQCCNVRGVMFPLDLHTHCPGTVMGIVPSIS